MTIEVKIPRDERGGIRHAAGYMRNGSHFKPQRASVRAGRSGNVCESGPHASALRLKIPKVSAIWVKDTGFTRRMGPFVPSKLRIGTLVPIYFW